MSIMVFDVIFVSVVSNLTGVAFVTIASYDIPQNMLPGCLLAIYARPTGIWGFSRFR